MKKTYICNMAEACQVTGTSDTPPMLLGRGDDSLFNAIECSHGVPHSKCWPDKRFECDRCRLKSWHYNLRTRYERGGNDLLTDERECIEITKENR
jgi:hypothetical protein